MVNGVSAGLLRMVILLVVLAGAAGPARAQEDASFWDSLYPLAAGSVVQQLATEWQPSPQAVTGKLDSLLSGRAIRDLATPRIAGFRILVYTGNERELAVKTKESLYREYPDADLYMSYQSPTFRVHMGDFYRKLDAYLVLKQMLPRFPGSVLVPAIVNLKP